MINFYPGPSKIHPHYGQIMAELCSSGLITFNHRSPEFGAAYAHTQGVLKDKLKIPKSYELVFFSSATECWQVVCQTFKEKKGVFLSAGAFADKWHEQGKAYLKEAQRIELKSSLTLAEQLVHLPKTDEPHLICYVQNETSTGAYVHAGHQKKIRKNFPKSIIAVDATSSLGGVDFDFSHTDIVFASVQKCLGLPPGLALMILSPDAIRAIQASPKSSRYNDLNHVLQNHAKAQTTHTPNTSGIVALGRVYEALPEIADVQKSTTLKAKLLNDFIESKQELSHLIPHPEDRSENVFCLQSHRVSQIIQQAHQQNMILGKGYGSLKESTFRIANFPSHQTEDIKKLIALLDQCTT